ncbi:MAG: murein L,D-transpeptidase catalytic domain family protein [Chitinophagaceae bacterium]
MKTLSLACISGSCFLGVLLFFYWKNNFVSPVYQVYAAETTMASKAAPESPSSPAPNTIAIAGSAASSETKTETKAFYAPVSSRFLVPAPVVSIDYDAVKTRIGTKRLVKKIDTRHNLLATTVVASSMQVMAPAPAVAVDNSRSEKAAEQAVVAVVEQPEAAVAHPAEAIAPATTEVVASNTTATHRSLTVVEEVKTEKKSFYIPSYMATRQTEAGNTTYSYMMLYDKAEKLKSYAEEHGYDMEYAFMLDMGMKSGKKRFFVVDLVNMTIVKSGLVAHGRGNERFTFDKKYSNKPGSNCSSLGVYKVGKFYNGIFGPAYRLVGLQESNSNASQRAIVLHGMNCIPNEESDFPVCQSEGCPSLSPQFLKDIRPIIDGRAKPMLLWMFDSRAESDGL